MVVLRVSDGGFVHEFLWDVVLIIASGLLARSAPVLKKMRVTTGGSG